MRPSLSGDVRLQHALSFGPHTAPTGSTQPLATWHLVLTATPTRQIPVPACPRCTSAKAIPAPPLIYLPQDQPFCPHHWLWLADQPNDNPINLAIHSDLLRAAKRHLRIRTQRGIQPTAAAVSTATRLWFRYRRTAAVPKPLQQRWANRRAALILDRHGHILITRYPEIIALAAMNHIAPLVRRGDAAPTTHHEPTGAGFPESAPTNGTTTSNSPGASNYPTPIGSAPIPATSKPGHSARDKSASQLTHPD